jgi:hypothetical protein
LTRVINGILTSHSIMTIGRLQLLARHEPHQESQTDEPQQQRATEAGRQAQHHFRELAERHQERHCKPPTVLISAALALACR